MVFDLIPELKAVYPWSGVRPSSTISNMNISATSKLITMKFYQKHHLDGRKAALGYRPDWIKTLVSMATDGSHRVIMEKTVLPLFMPPTLKKWGTYWFRLVRVCVCVCVYVFMFEISS